MILDYNQVPNLFNSKKKKKKKRKEQKKMIVKSCEPLK